MQKLRYHTCRAKILTNERWNGLEYIVEIINQDGEPISRECPRCGETIYPNELVKDPLVRGDEHTCGYCERTGRMIFVPDGLDESLPYDTYGPVWVCNTPPCFIFHTFPPGNIAKEATP